MSQDALSGELNKNEYYVYPVEIGGKDDIIHIHQILINYCKKRLVAVGHANNPDFNEDEESKSIKNCKKMIQTVHIDHIKSKPKQKQLNVPFKWGKRFDETSSIIGGKQYRIKTIRSSIPFRWG